MLNLNNNQSTLETDEDKNGAGLHSRLGLENVGFLLSASGSQRSSLVIGNLKRRLTDVRMGQVAHVHETCECEEPFIGECCEPFDPEEHRDTRGSDKYRAKKSQIREKRRRLYVGSYSHVGVKKTEKEEETIQPPSVFDLLKVFFISMVLSFSINMLVWGVYEGLMFIWRKICTFFFVRQRVQEESDKTWINTCRKAEEAYKYFGSKDMKYISKLFRDEALKLHPDKGGKVEEMTYLSELFNAAKEVDIEVKKGRSWKLGAYNPEPLTMTIELLRKIKTRSRFEVGPSPVIIDKQHIDDYSLQFISDPADRIVFKQVLDSDQAKYYIVSFKTKAGSTVYIPPTQGGRCTLYAAILSQISRSLMFQKNMKVYGAVLDMIRDSDSIIQDIKRGRIMSHAEQTMSLGLRTAMDQMLDGVFEVPTKETDGLSKPNGKGFSIDYVEEMLGDQGVELLRHGSDTDVVSFVDGGLNTLHACFIASRPLRWNVMTKEFMEQVQGLFGTAFDLDAEVVFGIDQDRASKDVLARDLARYASYKGLSYAVFGSNSILLYANVSCSDPKDFPLFCVGQKDGKFHPYALGAINEGVDTTVPEKGAIPPLSFKIPEIWSHLPFQSGEKDYDPRLFIKEVLEVGRKYLIKESGVGGAKDGCYVKGLTHYNPSKFIVDQIQADKQGFYVGLECPHKSRRYNLFSNLGYVYFKGDTALLYLNGYAGELVMNSEIAYGTRHPSFIRRARLDLGVDIALTLFEYSPGERDGFIVPELPVEPRVLKTFDDLIASVFTTFKTYRMVYSSVVQQKVENWLNMSSNWMGLFKKPESLSLCYQYVVATSKEHIPFDMNFAHFVMDAQNKCYNVSQDFAVNSDISIFNLISNRLVLKVNESYGTEIRNLLSGWGVVGARDKTRSRENFLILFLISILCIFPGIFISLYYGGLNILDGVHCLYICLSTLTYPSVYTFWTIIIAWFWLSTFLETLVYMFRHGLRHLLCYYLLGALVLVCGICLLYRKAKRIGAIEWTSRDHLWGEALGNEYGGVPIHESKLKALRNYVFDESCSLIKRAFYNLRGVKINYGAFVKQVEECPVRKNPITNLDAIPAGFRYLGAKIPLAEPVNGLWAFIIRHITPKVKPDPKCKINWKKVFKRHGIFSQFNEAWTSMPKRTFEEYLKEVESRKQPLYQKGWDAFKRMPIISMVLQIVVKPDEKQYKGEKFLDNILDFLGFKARNIFNPSDQVKAVLGYVMSEVMRALKLCPKFKRHFVQGWTTERLEEEVWEAWQSKKKPTGLAWDGGNHDAHQHAEFIKGVDNEFLQEVLPYVCPDLGFNEDETKEIIRKILLIECPVTLFAPKEMLGFTLLGSNRIKILSGVLNGTVFSGHPSRTTFGNTLRILLLIMVVCDDIGVEFGKDVHPFQSGDDTYVVMEEEFVDIFYKGLKKYYSEEEGVVHGYGQLMKDFKILGRQVDFLSKVGYIGNRRALIFRNPERLLTTGSISTSIGKTMTVPEYNFAITAALEASYKDFPGMNCMLNRRKNTLEHKFTRKYEHKFELIKEDHHGEVFWEDLGPYDKYFRVLEAFDGDCVSTLNTIRGNV